MNDMEHIDLRELGKRMDLVDMMISMHSGLSSKYERQALFLDIILIIISIILLTFVFVDQSFLNNFGLKESTAKLILGISSILISILSLLAYVIDWRGKKICHDQAFNVLVGLKNEWRIFFLNSKNITSDSAVNLEQKTGIILGQCITIDDKKFNKLKKKHYMKIALSKAISENPMLPLFVIKWHLLKKAFAKAKDCDL
jgi:hypothetical protein